MLHHLSSGPLALMNQRRKDTSETVAFSLLISETETNHRYTVLSGFLCVESADGDFEGLVCQGHKLRVSQPYNITIEKI